MTDAYASQVRLNDLVIEPLNGPLRAPENRTGPDGTGSDRYSNNRSPACLVAEVEDAALHLLCRGVDQGLDLGSADGGVTEHLREIARVLARARSCCRVASL